VDRPAPTFRTLATADGPAAVEVINAAAEWYREFLPPEEIHGPEMTLAEWEAEAERMTWFGAFVAAELVGVMGLEPIADVALLRHAYVLPDRQREGIGSLLLEHVERQAGDDVVRLIAGTYAANHKARSLLTGRGYRLSPDPAEVLGRYYAIPRDRFEGSVTFEKELAPRGR
jgi:GNAT superfamily N-acetyltransferase